MLAWMFGGCHEGQIPNVIYRKTIRKLEEKKNKSPYHDECMEKAEVTERRQVIDAVATTEVVQ